MEIYLSILFGAFVVGMGLGDENRLHGAVSMIIGTTLVAIEGVNFIGLVFG